MWREMLFFAISNARSYAIDDTDAARTIYVSHAILRAETSFRDGLIVILMSRHADVGRNTGRIEIIYVSLKITLS